MEENPEILGDWADDGQRSDASTIRQTVPANSSSTTLTSSSQPEAPESAAYSAPTRNAALIPLQVELYSCDQRLATLCCAPGNAALVHSVQRWAGV
jgi:hypothetical protein